jgi:acetyl-CoA synthetase
MTEAKLEAWLDEKRAFPPSESFVANANAKPSIYDEAKADPEAWWRKQAERLVWDKKPTSTLEWDLPNAKWFSDGTLNASVNCVDRHVAEGRGDKVAYYWVADADGESRTITYGELQKLVAKTANALIELGVKKGDRVAIYMPMIPEAVIAMRLPGRRGELPQVLVTVAIATCSPALCQSSAIDRISSESFIAVPPIKWPPANAGVPRSTGR